MHSFSLFAGSFSMVGTIYGVLGSLMLSLYSIYTKKILPHVNQQVWLLSYYNNAYSILLFIPLIVVNGELTILANYTNFHDPYFWFQMLIGGLCGFTIGYFTSLQIKVTLHYLKCLFTYISHMIYSDVVVVCIYKNIIFFSLLASTVLLLAIGVFFFHSSLSLR